MAVESDVFAQLSGFAALTALVPATRITPRRRVQGAALPAVCFWRVGGDRARHFGGDSGCGDALMQIDSYATEYSAAKAVQAQARAAMEAATTAFTVVRVAYGPDIYDDEEKVYVMPIDVTLVSSA